MVVGYYDYYIFKVSQKVGQLGNGFCIEVVGWFIEQEDVWIVEQGLCQEYFYFFFIVEVFYLVVVEGFVYVQVVKQFGCIVFGILVVYFFKFVFQFSGQQAIGFCGFGVYVDGIFVYYDVVYFLVAYDNGIEYLFFFVFKVVLFQNSYMVVWFDVYIVLVGSDFFGEDFQESGFVGVIGIDDIVVVVMGEFEVDFIKKDVFVVL